MKLASGLYWHRGFEVERREGETEYADGTWGKPHTFWIIAEGDTRVAFGPLGEDFPTLAAARAAIDAHFAAIGFDDTYPND